MISRNDLGNLIFPAKTVKQVAVLPFVVIGEEAKVLLLTSRSRGRWLRSRVLTIDGNTKNDPICFDLGARKGQRCSCKEGYQPASGAGSRVGGKQRSSTTLAPVSRAHVIAAALASV